jgi:hypothetical protein
VIPTIPEADAIHATLVRTSRCPCRLLGGPHEEAELKAIADLLEAYEAKRWPNGKEPGGKG